MTDDVIDNLVDVYVDLNVDLDGKERSTEEKAFYGDMVSRAVQLLGDMDKSTAEQEIMKEFGDVFSQEAKRIVSAAQYYKLKSALVGKE